MAGLCTSIGCRRPQAPFRPSWPTSHLKGAMNECKYFFLFFYKYSYLKSNSVALYEVMTRFVGPLCTILPHPPHNTPIAAVTTIIDLSNVSIRQMWNLRSHLQQASELANANYPETLGAVAVVNAPSFFATVWGWIKGWYDPATREKIRVLGSVGDENSKGSESANRALQELIDKKNLPKEYGGEMDWSFFDEPSLDEEAKKAVGGRMPKGPWIFDLLEGRVKRPGEYKGDDTVWPPSAEGSPAPTESTQPLTTNMRGSQQTFIEAGTEDKSMAKQAEAVQVALGAVETA